MTDQSASRSELADKLDACKLLVVNHGLFSEFTGKAAVPTDLLGEAVAALRSELTRSVAVKDMEIIGHREPGDAHKGRAWWSGGTWLQPGEVVAVLTLPKQDERPEP